MTACKGNGHWFELFQKIGKEIRRISGVKGTLVFVVSFIGFIQTFLRAKLCVSTSQTRDLETSNFPTVKN